jgi:hypothetical protein
MNRIDRNEPTKVTVRTKSDKFLGGHYDSFNSIDRVKSFVRNKYPNYSIVDVTISQDNGYYKNFKVKS